MALLRLLLLLHCARLQGYGHTRIWIRRHLVGHYDRRNGISIETMIWNPSVWMCLWWYLDWQSWHNCEQSSKVWYNRVLEHDHTPATFRLHCSVQPWRSTLVSKPGPLSPCISPQSSVFAASNTSIDLWPALSMWSIETSNRIQNKTICTGGHWLRFCCTRFHFHVALHSHFFITRFIHSFTPISIPSMTWLSMVM